MMLVDQVARPRRSSRPAHGLAAVLAVTAFSLLSASAWASPAEKGAPPCRSTSADVVCTLQGPVQGLVENGTIAFKGIPYAAPPVGERRWQPPGPAPRWSGIRDARQFGAICPQLAGTEVVGDEDCLTVNVWKPTTSRGKKLPVMVFLTGGGNHAFSGQGSSGFGGVNYNGQLLAPEGTVYVSFNYRLGALGFLAHPSLGEGRPGQVSGNYGSLDQIALLRWLRANISAFGGDPSRILLFGTSAGGGNICALMTAPMAKGLFSRAAMQASVPTGCELPTLAQAQEGTGARVVQTLGCDQGDTAACLRAKSTAEIVSAVPGTFGVLPRLYGPNVDGHVFPDQPRALIDRGAYARMPVIIGNSTEETMLFVNGLGPVTDAATYEAAIARVFGQAQLDRIVAAYPLTAYQSPREALVRLTTDALFTCQSRRVARLLSTRQWQPVYRYLFDHRLDNDPMLKAQGAVHTIEHAFFFPWQGSYQPTADDLAVQRQMIDRWTRFARWGLQPLAGDQAWLPAGPWDSHLLITPQPQLAWGDAGAQCAFWDDVPLPQPHL